MDVKGNILLILSGLCLAMAMDRPMENPDLFEGDIILTEEQQYEIENGRINPNIPLAAINTQLWPSPVVWDIDKSLLNEPKAVKVIEESIADYERYTCLQFKRRTTELLGYILFYNGRGCASPIGYSSSRRNGISLSPGCWVKGTVMHEIAHSLGFYHEQSRPDRDDHVKIHWDNIQGGLDDNFKKYGNDRIDSLNVPYDYLSMMHYPKDAFGIAKKITIETFDPAMQDLIGQRKGFSKLDILQMNLLYQCPGVTKLPPGTVPTHKPITKEKIISTTKPPRTIPSTGCVDKASNCKFYKDNNYCNIPGWKATMKNFCMESCEFCGTQNR